LMLFYFMLHFKLTESVVFVYLAYFVPYVSYFDYA
jgi:hypothetical protein